MDVTELVALIRRVVAACVSDAGTVDDIVQETFVRLLAARGRLDERALGPYGIVVARNLITSHWRRTANGRRLKHRPLDLREPATPDERVMRREETDAVRAALDASLPLNG